MTDRQLKELAEIALTTDSRLSLLITCFQALAEKMEKMQPPDQQSLSLIQAFEQMEALQEESKQKRAAFRMELGLPPEN